MKKFIATIIDKDSVVRAEIPVYADDNCSSGDVIKLYEEQEGQRVGEMNRFGGILRGIIEVPFTKSIVIESLYVY